jgi:AcrR family transcriptional regulator
VITPGSPGGGRPTPQAPRGRRLGATGASRAEEARTHLLAAAERLLAQRPAAELSVEAVCRAAGVPRAQFDLLFADRDELLLAVFDRLVAGLAAEMEGAYRAEPCWRDAVRAALDALLARLDRARGLGRFLIVDSLSCDPVLLARRASVLARLAGELDAGHPEPAAAVPPATFGAAAVVGGVVSILHSRLQEGSAEPLSELSGAIMGMIVTPYLGAQAARDELARARPRPRARPRAPARRRPGT